MINNLFRGLFHVFDHYMCIYPCYLISEDSRFIAMVTKMDIIVNTFSKVLVIALNTLVIFYKVY